MNSVDTIELKKANRRANLGVLFIFISVGLCLSTMGRAWWLSLLSFVPLLLAFGYYEHWRTRVWNQIERYYGRRMRPW